MVSDTLEESKHNTKSQQTCALTYEHGANCHGHNLRAGLIILPILEQDFYQSFVYTSEIHIAKHRNGPTGQVKVFFDAARVTFKNLDRRRMESSAPPPMISAPPNKPSIAPPVIDLPKFM